MTAGVRLRAPHARVGDGLGPVAMVVCEENYWQVARVLGILEGPKRPMRMFKQVDKAGAWLDSRAIITSVPG